MAKNGNRSGNKQQQAAKTTTDQTKQEELQEQTVETQETKAPESSDATGGAETSAATTEGSETSEGDASDALAETVGETAPAVDAAVLTGGDVSEEEQGDEQEAPVIELHPFTQVVLAYAEAMNPSKIATSTIIQQNQIKLYHAIMDTVTKLEGQEFANVWGQILNAVNENKGPFQELYLFRGFDTIRIPKQNMSFYQGILTLISNTADPAKRKIAVQTISFDTLFEKRPSAEIQKVAGFYR